MTPLFTSLCDLAERIPAMTADFLQLETQVRRRFKEDSITDLLIASLLRVGGGDATLFTPPETKTGGDFDLVIHGPESGVSVQYRIQAKRLVPNSINWAWGLYKELDHPHGTGMQASTLIRSSAREKLETIPLYAFYHPVDACKASGDEIAGIELADGRAVGAIVRALLKAKTEGKRPRWKRVEHLRHLFFPLSTILCQSSSGSSDRSLVIRPEASRQAALAAIKERRIKPTDLEDAPPQLTSDLRRLGSPSAHDQVAVSSDRPRGQPRERESQSSSRLIERAIVRRQGDSAIQRAKVKRTKLVLLSR